MVIPFAARLDLRLNETVCLDPRSWGIFVSVSWNASVISYQVLRTMRVCCNAVFRKVFHSTTNETRRRASCRAVYEP